MERNILCSNGDWRIICGNEGRDSGSIFRNIFKQNESPISFLINLVELLSLYISRRSHHENISSYNLCMLI